MRDKIKAFPKGVKQSQQTGMDLTDYFAAKAEEKVIMNDKSIEQAMNDYKTLCCKSEYYRQGRANYRCKNCDKDITMELVFLHQALENESE